VKDRDHRENEALAEKNNHTPHLAIVDETVDMANTTVTATPNPKTAELQGGGVVAAKEIRTVMISAALLGFEMAFFACLTMDTMAATHTVYDSTGSGLYWSAFPRTQCFACSTRRLDITRHAFPRAFCTLAVAGPLSRVSWCLRFAGRPIGCDSGHNQHRRY